MRILQIIPADGWFVLYTVNGKQELYPVTCWALKEKGDDDGIYQYVIGMTDVAGFTSLMEINEEGGEFEGYRFKGTAR